METYNGHVRTPNDAIILFEACRLGVLPRVQRRLSEKERQAIRSGSVFVWDEREAGMRRWTDGKSWSASRVSGSFLTYREMEGKRGGNGFASSQSSKKGATRSDGGSSRGEGDADSGEDGPDGYRYKPDGLMKQSFSITTNNGQHLHLISYYARSQSNSATLKQPSTDSTLRHIHPAKGMYPEATVNEAANVPAVTRGPMPGSPYEGAHQQVTVSSYPAHLVPHGFPPPYHRGNWPEGPAGAPSYAYYTHPPPPPPPGHTIAQHYTFHHSYAPPPPGAMERPPYPHHVPQPPLANGQSQQVSHGPYYVQPPMAAHPQSYTPSPYAPPPDYRAHLPSPGPATTAGAEPPSSLDRRDPSLHVSALNGHRPLTPPHPASTSAAEPLHSSHAGQNGSSHATADNGSSHATADNGSSHGAQNGTVNCTKTLPTIDALINADNAASAPMAPMIKYDATNEANGRRRSSSSRSPPDDSSKLPAISVGPTGLPPMRDVSKAGAGADKGSCRADVMAISALDSRFGKTAT